MPLPSSAFINVNSHSSPAKLPFAALPESSFIASNRAKLVDVPLTTPTREGRASFQRGKVVTTKKKKK